MTKSYNCYQRPTITLTLSLDVVSVDVTAIIEAFQNDNDYDRLMLSAKDFCLPGDDSKYAWIYAKEAVEDWHFKGRLYRQLREWYIERGMPEEIMWRTKHLELRAMLLQDLAVIYMEYLNHDALTGLNSYSSFGEWLTDSGEQYLCLRDGHYWLCIDA